MRLTACLAALLTAALLLSPPAGAEKEPGLPAPDAAELWTHLTKTDDYGKWEPWAEFPGLVKSFGDMGAELVRVYPNGIATRAIQDKSAPPWPYGSIFVRQGFNQDEKGTKKKLIPVGFTVIYKVKGFNPQLGDWFFAKYDAGGKVLAQGKVDECMRCHKSAWRNDYVKKNARTYRVQ